jgi:O-6-methylguanine DNA methyltransferase
MGKMCRIEHETPVGTLVIAAADNRIVEILFKGENNDKSKTLGDLNKLDQYHDILKKCTDELDAYFKGKLTAFTVPIKASGTPFREGVWRALQSIPFGETISYKELAERIGNPAAIRAVGGANHHNPINIIIPCHRVIGANGSLTGYGGGLDKKEFLLKHEGVFIA